MRILIAAAALIGAGIAGTAVMFSPHPAHAQTLDRYGGSTAATPPVPSGPTQPTAMVSAYPPPAYATQQGGSPSPYPAAPYPPTLYPATTYAARRSPPPASPARTPYPTAYAPPTAAAAGLRILSWPGKDPAPPLRTAVATPNYGAPYGYTAPAPLAPSAVQATRYAPATYPAIVRASLPSSGGVQARPTALREVPVYQQGSAPPPPMQPQAYAFAPPPVATTSRAPTSIYNDGPVAVPAPPAQTYAQPAVVAQASGADLSPEARAAQLGPPNPNATARLYSVHRDYGLTPDPAPIPPQFFANTADLSTPETPDVPTRAPSTTTAGATAARAAQNSARLAGSDQ